MVVLEFQRHPANASFHQTEPLLLFRSFKATQLDTTGSKLYFSGEIGYHFPEYTLFEHIVVTYPIAEGFIGRVRAEKMKRDRAIMYFSGDVHYEDSLGRVLTSTHAIYDRREKRLVINVPFRAYAPDWNVEGSAAIVEFDERLLKIDHPKMRIHVPENH